MFTPIQQSYGNILTVYETSKLPYELMALAERRWSEVTNTLRAKLYSGEVVAYYPSAETGMTPFMTCNYWLDDKKAEGILRQGGLRFNKDELRAALPPLKETAATKRPSGRTNYLKPLEKHLRAHYSLGKPDNMTVAVWFATVKEKMGPDYPFEISTFKTAMRATRPQK